jgi:hypothetical protein
VRTAARGGRRTGADWSFVFGRSSEIVGAVEQLADGRWLALGPGAKEIGITNTRQAAVELVLEEAGQGEMS